MKSTTLKSTRATLPTTAPRLFRKQTITAEAVANDAYVTTIELTLSQSEGISLTFSHICENGPELLTPTHTLFGLLHTKDAAGGEGSDAAGKGCIESFLEPDEFVAFVEALNVLAAQVPAMIAATNYRPWDERMTAAS